MDRPNDGVNFGYSGTDSVTDFPLGLLWFTHKAEIGPDNTKYPLLETLLRIKCRPMKAMYSYLRCGAVRTRPGATYQSKPFGEMFDAEQTVAGTEHFFTGKERDTESGLDYFGARYYGSSMGRFMSPDPILSTPMHLLDPQRWNKYAYVLNRPLSMTDPDGLDAIAVNFSKEIPMVGHEGIMSVRSDGSATYARFGPVGGSRPSGDGLVQSFNLTTKVQFDSNGQPTPESLNAVAAELGNSGLSPEKGQDPSSIRLNYFKLSDGDTANLDTWIKQQQAASDQGKAPKYNVMTSNCTMFCQRGLVAGNAISQSQASKSSIVPNYFWYQLRQHEDTWDPKTNTLTAQQRWVIVPGHLRLRLLRENAHAKNISDLWIYHRISCCCDSSGVLVG